MIMIGNNSIMIKLFEPFIDSNVKKTANKISSRCPSKYNKSFDLFT